MYRIAPFRYLGTNNRRPARILGRNRGSSETFSVHLLLRDLGARHGYVGRYVTDLQDGGHGFWMPKLRVVESRIFDGTGGFRCGVEPFVGFDLPFGYGVFFAFRVQWSLGVGWSEHDRRRHAVQWRLLARPAPAHE